MWSERSQSGGLSRWSISKGERVSKGSRGGVIGMEGTEKDGGVIKGSLIHCDET